MAYTGNRDHPVEIQREGIYTYAQIREFWEEFIDNEDYGWVGRGAMAALNRTFGLKNGSIQNRLAHGWIWPREQPGFTRIINQLISGELVPVRTGPNTMAAVFTENPTPPVPRSQKMKMHAQFAPVRSPVTARRISPLKLKREPPTMPPPALPRFSHAFETVLRARSQETVADKSDTADAEEGVG